MDNRRKGGMMTPNKVRKISKTEAEVSINRVILYIRQFDITEDKVIRDHHNNLVDFEDWLLEEKQ